MLDAMDIVFTINCKFDNCNSTPLISNVKEELFTENRVRKNANFHIIYNHVEAHYPESWGRVPKFIVKKINEGLYEINPVMCSNCLSTKYTQSDSITPCDCYAIVYCQGCFTPVCGGCLMDYHQPHHYDDERKKYGVISILDIIGRDFSKVE